jgi:hypothetical protein
LDGLRAPARESERGLISGRDCALERPTVSASVLGGLVCSLDRLGPPTMLSGGFRDKMRWVVGEVVLGIPRECAMACRGTAVGSRRYLARLHDVNDYHSVEKG